MTRGHYTAEVKSNRLLELPVEAERLHLKPGDKVEVRLVRTTEPTRQGNPKEERTEPKQLRGRGMLAGILSTEEFLHRKHEETIHEDRPLR